MQIFPAGSPQFSVPLVFMVKTFAVQFIHYCSLHYMNKICTYQICVFYILFMLNHTTHSSKTLLCVVLFNMNKTLCWQQNQRWLFITNLIHFDQCVRLAWLWSKHISKPFQISSQSSLLISLSMPLFASRTAAGSHGSEKLPHFYPNGFQSLGAHFIAPQLS